MADYVVTGPDGSKYKMSADNEEALNHAVGEMFKAPQGAPAPSVGEPPPGTMAPPKVAAAPAPAAEPSLVDRVMAPVKRAGEIINMGVRGAGEGIADTLGTPGTLGTPTPIPHVSMFGGFPFVTGEGIKAGLDYANNKIADTLGVTRPRTKPEGFGEEISHRVGQEVGAAMVPVGGAYKTGVNVGVDAARAAIPEAGKHFGHSVVDFFKQAPAKMVESAAADPGKFVGREASTTTAAGTGAALVNEITGKADAESKGQQPTIGQQAGDIGGAVGGAGLYAVGKKIIDVGGHVISALTGKSSTADGVVRDVATDEIARAAGLKPDKNGVIDTAPLADSIAKGKPVSETIPGFQESTADRTKNGGLAAMEYGRQSGPNSGLYTARRGANVDAVDEAMKRSEPQSTPGAFSSELEAERDRQLLETINGRDKAAAEATKATEGLAPKGTSADRGNTVRSALEDARDEARARTEEAYKAAGIDKKTMDPAGLSDALDNVTNGLTEVEKGLAPQGTIKRVQALGQSAEGGGPVSTGLLDEMGQPITRAGAPAEPISMKEALDLRSELQRMQRAALADPNAEKGGRNAARVIGQYLDTVDSHIAGQLAPGERQALEAARGAKFEEAQGFTRRGDPVAEALARHEGGNPRVSDSNVAGKFVDPQAMDRLFAAADTPATREAIRNEVLSNADTSTTSGIDKFTTKYAEQLKRFPGLADDLAKAKAARGAEAAAGEAVDTLHETIGPDGKGVVAKYLQYGDENATKAMTAVLNHKDPAKAMDDLLNFVKDDPKAVEGARKTFWDILQKKTRSDGSTTKTVNGAQPYLPAALKRFTEDPATAAVAKRLYRDNPEHWDNITKITEAMQGVDVRNAAKAPNTSGTPQGLQPGFLPSGETLASRIFAVERGVVSPTFAALNVAGIIARKAIKRQSVDAVNKAIDTALLDPEFAAALLKQNNPANRAALTRATKGWQTHEAQTFLGMLAPDSKDDETKKAVMK